MKNNIDSQIKKIIDIFNSTISGVESGKETTEKPIPKMVKIGVYNLKDEKLRVFRAPRKPENIKIDSVNICTKLTLKVSARGYHQKKTIHLSGDKKRENLIFKDENGQKIRTEFN